MRTGELTKRITIEKNTPTEAGSGSHYQLTDDWVAHMSAWAKIDSGPSREYWAARQKHQDATHVITIRWRDDFDITAEVRLCWTDRAQRNHIAYPLGPPTNLFNNANQWLEFVCREQVETT